jgi:hypothetical protein
MAPPGSLITASQPCPVRGRITTPVLSRTIHSRALKIFLTSTKVSPANSPTSLATIAYASLPPRQFPTSPPQANQRPSRDILYPWDLHRLAIASANGSNCSIENALCFHNLRFQSDENPRYQENRALTPGNGSLCRRDHAR